MFICLVCIFRMLFTAPSGDNLSIPEHKLDGPGKAKPEPKAKYADIAAASSTEQGIRVRALYNYQAGG